MSAQAIDMAVLAADVHALRERLEIVAQQMAEERAAKAKNDALLRTVLMAAAEAYIDRESVTDTSPVAPIKWGLARGLLKVMRGRWK